MLDTDLIHMVRKYLPELKLQADKNEILWAMVRCINADLGVNPAIGGLDPLARYSAGDISDAISLCWKE